MHALNLCTCVQRLSWIFPSLFCDMCSVMQFYENENVFFSFLLSAKWNNVPVHYQWFTSWETSPAFFPSSSSDQQDLPSSSLCQKHLWWLGIFSGNNRYNQAKCNVKTHTSLFPHISLYLQQTANEHSPTTYYVKRRHVVPASSTQPEDFTVNSRQEP